MFKISFLLLASLSLAGCATYWNASYGTPPPSHVHRPPPPMKPQPMPPPVMKPQPRPPAPSYPARPGNSGGRLQGTMSSK